MELIVHLRQHAEGPPPLLSTVAQGVDPLPPLHPQGGLHQDAPLPSQGILAFPFIEIFGVSGCYLDKGRPRPVVKSSGALPVDQTHRPKFSTRPELGVFRLPFPDSSRVNPDAPDSGETRIGIQPFPGTLGNGPFPSVPGNGPFPSV